MNPRPRALLIHILREPQMPRAPRALLAHNRILQLRIRRPPERPPSKQELVRAHAERPPVDGVGVPALGQDLGCHVCHAARYARQHPALREMHGDIEVCQMGVSALVQENVVGLDVSAVLNS